MKPVYLDLHIHTSDDPNHLNENYDLDTLIEKVTEKAQGNDFLISLTDHNTINEKVYLAAIEKIKNNLILGAELHIQTHKGETTKAYHCHILFNFEDTEISSDIIKDINSKLDNLYPNKTPLLSDEGIPLIQQIIETFDEYDFILLPHGGQNHATFDDAMPSGKRFDNAMQRSIYYNFFDGFTSRSNKHTEKSLAYLERLGVKEFVNLITCTDNYNPSEYPKPKNDPEHEFIPTWMFASPTFEGIRISLSDSTRIEYSHEKPRPWREFIKGINLQDDNIDIDVKLTPGLNVIIGESSSGKTLLVDSLYRKITEVGFDDEECKYNHFNVQSIIVDYPDNLDPHFLKQNFIASVTGDNKKLNDIEIIRKILPKNSSAEKIINKGLNKLRDHLNSLFSTIEHIEDLEEEIKKIPILSELIISDEVNENILKRFIDTINSVQNIDYSNLEMNEDIELLNRLDNKLKTNPFIEYNKDVIKTLISIVKEMQSYSILESKVRDIVENRKIRIDKNLEINEGESQRRKQDFDQLIGKMKDYYSHLVTFEKILNKISEYSIKSESGRVKIQDYVLSIENKFELNKEALKNELNNLLLSEKAIKDFDDITPESLFRCNFKRTLSGVPRGSGVTYKVIIENICTRFFDKNQISYKIKTPHGDDFDNLSPGLKTSIILELILNFEQDRAPLIIDQPEDNLATSYMNEGLVKSIKKMKYIKQIIFVSHNATIPMAGDAQNVILCKNIDGKIIIRSNPLEGKINNINVVDHIAKIADGGKPSIKKRFKKYNLKNFYG